MTKEELIKRLETTCFGLDPIDPLRLLVDDVIEALRENAMREVQRLEQEPVAWEQFYPDIGKPQIEQPKVRTGDCLLVGVCASEGHKIQAKQEQEEYLSKAYRLANELRCHLAIAPAPQRTWVGLTDGEANELWESTDSDWELMKRTEAKLKERNA